MSQNAPIREQVATRLRHAEGFGLSIAEVMTLNQREPSSDLDVIVSALRNQPNKVIAIARRLVLALLTDPP